MASINPPNNYALPQHIIDKGIAMNTTEILSIKFILLATALALTGCASPNNLRQLGLTTQVENHQSARYVATCITDQWDAMGFTPASRETLNGYSLTVVVAGLLSNDTAYLVDVIRNDDGKSTSKFYNGQYSGEKAKMAVMACSK